MSELLSLDEPRKRVAGLISGLDIRYDLGEGRGRARIFTLLHDARPLLIRFGDYPHDPAVSQTPRRSLITA